MSTETVTTPEQNLTMERLKSLYELIRRMNSVYELPELLEFIIDRALSLTGGRRALLLFNSDDNPVPNELVLMRGKALAEPDLARIKDFVSNTVIQDVLEQGETRLVLDLPVDERFEGRTSRDTLRSKSIRSVLAVPLKAEERLVGLLYIDHPAKAIFGQDELDFLDAFAGQAALAIHRTREHQRQIEELTLLNELSRSVVKVLDVDEVLTRIVTEVIRMLNVEASSVLLLDDTATELVFATSVHRDQRLHISARLKRDEGIAGWVMTHGQPIYVNDVHQDPRWFGEVNRNFETHSILCVPLQQDGRTLGVLEALNKQGMEPFNTSNITLLSAFAASASVAIENARLFQEARQARQLRALNEIALKLSSSLDLSTILDEGLKQSLQVLKAESGAVTLINAQTQTDLLSVQVSPNLLHNPVLEERQSQAVSGMVAWLLDQTFVDFFDDDIFVIDAAHPANANQYGALLDNGVTALAMAPLEVGGSTGGGLAVMHTTEHTFSVEEVSLLSSVARIVGLAAQNAVHYLQMQAQTAHLKYLNQIGSALTRSLDVDRVLQIIIEGVNTLLQTELTSVFLIDEESNELVLRYTTKGDAEIRLPAPWQGIAGWVATHDQPALVNNTQSDPRHLRQVAVETGYRAESILCVPLKVEGQIIGVVEVLNKTGGQQFSHYHQALLMELTKWAAIALHNARLFDERVRAYERLSTEQKRRIAAETRGAMAAIILDMAHTMNNVVGAIRAWAINLEYAVTDMPGAPLVNFEKSIRQIRQNTEEAIKLMATMTGPLEQVAVSSIDVKRCLEAAIESCWWPDNVHLTKRFDADIPMVKANAKRLEAVFHNLLSNAIQAMQHSGGQIQACLRRNEGEQVKIIISDNGPGIPPNLRERIFDPGVSDKEGSLGIGLWLVETFVHQFEGQIGFVSSESTGAEFAVTLPAVPTNDDGTEHLETTDGPTT